MTQYSFDTLPARPHWRAPALALALLLLLASARVGGDPPPRPVELVVRTGHAEPIADVSLSGDGRYVLSSPDGGAARVWDVASGEELRALSNGASPGFAASSFAGDSTRAAIRSDNGLQLVDALTGQLLAELPGEPADIAVSDRGRFVARVTRRQQGVRILSDVSIVDLTQVTGPGTFTTPNLVTPVAISEDGTTLLLRNTAIPDPRKMLAAAREGRIALPDSTLEVWNARTGKLQHVLAIPADLATEDARPALSPNGRLLAVQTIDASLMIHDVASGALVHTLAPPHEPAPGHGGTLHFSADGRLLARALTNEGPGEITVWEVASGQSAAAFAGIAVNFSADGRTLVFARRATGVPLLRDLASGREAALAGGTQPVGELVATDDGRTLIALSRIGGAKQWDLASGELVRTIDCPGGAPAASASASATRRWLAMGCFDGAAYLWDLDTGAKLQELAPPLAGDWGTQVVAQFAPDGLRLALAIGNHVSIRDLGAGREVARLDLPPAATEFGPEYFAKVDAQNRAMGVFAGLSPQAAAAQRAVMAATEQSMTTPRGATFVSSARVLAFTADGQRLAIARPFDVLVADVSTGRLLRTLGGGARASRDGRAGPGTPQEAAQQAEAIERAGAHQLAFMPDGRSLVALTAGGEQVWDIETGQATAARAPRADAFDDVEVSYADALALSADGHLEARSHNGAIELREPASGRVIATLGGHAGAIASLAFARGGVWLISGSSDGFIRLWSVAERREVAALVALGASDFVTVTPDQYYRASKGRLNGVAFRIADKLYPFEQFDLRFNRPDLVMERLGQAPAELVQRYRAAYHKRLRRLGVAQLSPSDDLRLPTLTVVGPEVPVSVAATSLRLRIRAVDEAVPLDRVNAFVNDVPIFGSQGLTIADRSTHLVEQEIVVPLVAGRNRIQFSVMNQRGAESLRPTLYTTSTAPGKPPDIYIVAIGVSEYRNAAYNLRFAAKDAMDLGEAYGTLGARPGPRGVLHRLDLTNARATREGIRAAKRWLGTAQPQDLVIVFAAGHGMTDHDNNYFFGTYDIDPDHPETAGLPYEDFETLLDGIAPLRKVLLLDTCFSGEIDQDRPVELSGTNSEAAGTVRMRTFKAARGVTVVADPAALAPGTNGLPGDTLRFQQELFADLRRGTGAVVISSASGNEYALEGEQWRNGVFTYALLSGLRDGRADLNGDHSVSVGELQAFVIGEVRRLTAGGQNPTVRRENLEFDFAVFD